MCSYADLARRFNENDSNDDDQSQRYFESNETISSDRKHFCEQRPRKNYPKNHNHSSSNRNDNYHRHDTNNHHFGSCRTTRDSSHSDHREYHNSDFVRHSSSENHQQQHPPLRPPPPSVVISENYNGPINCNGNISIKNLIEKQSWEYRTGVSNEFDTRKRGYDMSREMRGRDGNTGFCWDEEKENENHRAARGGQRNKRKMNDGIDDERASTSRRSRSRSRSRSGSRSKSGKRQATNNDENNSASTPSSQPGTSFRHHQFHSHEQACDGERWSSSSTSSISRNRHDNRHEGRLSSHRDDKRSRGGEHCEKKYPSDNYTNHKINQRTRCYNEETHFRDNYPSRRKIHRQDGHYHYHRDSEESWRDTRNNHLEKTHHNDTDYYYTVYEPPPPVMNFIPQREASKKFDPFMILLVGIPKSGKTTFSQMLTTAKPWKYVRVPDSSSFLEGKTTTNNNDDEKRCRDILLDGKCPIVDLCNINPNQRKCFLDIAKETNNTPVECVVFTYAVDVCIGRFYRNRNNSNKDYDDNQNHAIMDAHCEERRKEEVEKSLKEMARHFSPPLPNRINAETQFRRIQNITNVYMANDVALEYIFE